MDLSQLIENALTVANDNAAYRNELALAQNESPKILAQFKNGLDSVVNTCSSKLDDNSQMEHASDGSCGTVKFLQSRLDYSFDDGKLEVTIESDSPSGEKLEETRMSFYSRRTARKPNTQGTQITSRVWYPNPYQNGNHKSEEALPLYLITMLVEAQKLPTK